MTSIRERMRTFNTDQLDSVVDVLESLDIDGWNNDLLDHGTYQAPWNVSTLLNRAQVLRRLKQQ